jgi:hypothetical protein
VSTAFLFLLGAHYIADFPLQGSFLADMKGQRYYLLFAHSIIYATVIAFALFLFGAYADWKFIAVLILHMSVDKWKASKPRDAAHWHLIYYDQGIHIALNTLLLFVR